jgi:hypothetical protein
LTLILAIAMSLHCRTTTKKDWSFIKEGQEVPTYPLDDETHSRRYNYFEGGVAEPELHSTEGAERVYTASLRGVTENVKPRLAPWKVQNFTEEEIDEVRRRPVINGAGTFHQLTSRLHSMWCVGGGDIYI